jgi:hypothetical protein
LCSVAFWGHGKAVRGLAFGVVMHMLKVAVVLEVCYASLPIQRDVTCRVFWYDL